MEPIYPAEELIGMITQGGASADTALAFIATHNNSKVMDTIESDISAIQPNYALEFAPLRQAGLQQLQDHVLAKPIPEPRKIHDVFVRMCENIWFKHFVEDHKHAPTVAAHYIVMGGRRENTALTHILSRNKEKVLVACKHNAALCQDLMQDGIVILSDKVKKKELGKPGSIHSFFIGICKNLYRKWLESQKKTIFQEIEEAKVQQKPDDLMDLLLQGAVSERNALLHAKLSEAGKDCKKILLERASGVRSVALARALGTTEDVINSRATQCRRKLITLLVGMLDDSCKIAIRIYQPHKRTKRGQSPDSIFVQIAQELGFKGEGHTERAKRVTFSCMKQLYDIFLPQPDFYLTGNHGNAYV